MCGTWPPHGDNSSSSPRFLPHRYLRSRVLATCLRSSTFRCVLFVPSTFAFNSIHTLRFPLRIFRILLSRLVLTLLPSFQVLFRASTIYATVLRTLRAFRSASWLSLFSFLRFSRFLLLLVYCYKYVIFKSVLALPRPSSHSLHALLVPNRVSRIFLSRLALNLFLPGRVLRAHSSHSVAQRPLTILVRSCACFFWRLLLHLFPRSFFLLSMSFPSSSFFWAIKSEDDLRLHGRLPWFCGSSLRPVSLPYRLTMY